MLYEIEILEARRIAELAATAREARDRALAPVREAELGRTAAGRRRARSGKLPRLRRPVRDRAGASGAARGYRGVASRQRRKLWVVMRTGRGDYAKDDGTARSRPRRMCRTRALSATSQRRLIFTIS